MHSAMHRPMVSPLHQLTFPKKQGAALAAAAPFVNEVYQDEYPSAPSAPLSDWSSSSSSSSNTGDRSVKITKLLHMTVHSIPRRHRGARLALLAAFVLAWILLYPAATKVLTVTCALAYSFVETAFTAIERRRPYTSLAQFGANLLYIPVLLHGYHKAVLCIGGHGPLLYVAAFPLNVWLLEVVEEWAILRPLFGHNVAWCYRDYTDEFLLGCVRLGHGVAWWGMGAALWLVYPPLAAWSETAAAALIIG